MLKREPAVMLAKFQKFQIPKLTLLWCVFNT